MNRIFKRKEGEDKALNKKAATSAVALVAAASMLVSNLFGAPADMMITKQEAPAPLTMQVQMIEDDTDDDDTENEENGETEETEEVKKGFGARMRERILAMPIAIRAIIGVPLWCIGFALDSLLSALWSFIISPVLSGILSWLCPVLITAALAVLFMKLLMPDVPLKKLMSRKGLFTAFIICAVIWGIDAILPYLWTDYERISKITEAVLLLMLSAGIAGFTALAKIKNKQPQAE